MKSRQDVSKEHLNNGLNEKKNQSREDLGKGSSGRELAGSDGKASAYNVGDLGSIPGSGRSPGEGNGNPLQYSCLENPIDRGSWQATVHGVAKSQTQLSATSLHFKEVKLSVLKTKKDHVFLKECERDEIRKVSKF